MADPNFKPSPHKPIAKEALDQLFLEARTHNKWQAKPVPQSLLRQLADVLKMGPTSANSSPARFLFLESRSAKERLSPFMSEGNRAKTAAAPVTAIVGYDTEFHEKLPKLFPHADARSWFVGKPEHIQDTAFRNSSLQGAYFIIAARALGLDTGPDVRLRRGRREQGIFPRRQGESKFHLQSRLWRSRRRHAALAAFHL